MLDPKTNSNRRQNSTFMETLQDKLKDIKNFSNWFAKEQMVAVTVVGVIFGALLPVVAVALPVAATGAAVVLTLFFAVKAVEYAFKGLKWSAEKTWEGAKYTAGKIKAGAMYAKDSVKKGYENSVGSLKRGAKNAADRLGSSLKEFAHSGEHLMESESVQKLLQQKEIKEVVNDIIEIAKADNSSVLPAIKSAMKSMIESAMRLGTLGSADKGNLEKQMKIIDRLDKILINSTLDTEELNLVTTIFSKYQNKVKGILYDYKQHPEKYPKPPTLSQKMSSSLSFSSLRRKDSKQSGGSKVKVPLQGPFSSDLGVVHVTLRQ